MRFRTIALVTALTLAAPIAAQQQAGPPGARDAARVTAGTYAANGDHSLISWKVDRYGFTDYFGLLGSLSGTLTLDPANLSAAKIDVTIPVAKVLTTAPGLTAHMLRPGANGAKPDFFGPNPADAHFVSKRVTVTGLDATVLGDLTLNGVTKEVTVKASLKGAGKSPRGGTETVGFNASGSFKRSDFGLTFGLPNISDEVRLDISMLFEKK